MLVIRDLVKKYGNFTAVDHLNMHVERGQIYGFIGPNEPENHDHEDCGYPAGTHIGVCGSGR